MLKFGRHAYSLQRGEHHNNLTFSSIIEPNKIQKDTVHRDVQKQPAQTGILGKKYRELPSPPPCQEHGIYWDSDGYTMAE